MFKNDHQSFFFSPSSFPSLASDNLLASWTRKRIVRLLSLKEWEARVYGCDQQNAETAWRGRESGRPAVLDPLPSFVRPLPRPARFLRMPKCESLIAVDSFLWKIRTERPQPRDFFSIWSRTRKFKEIMRNRVKAFAAVIVFCVFVRRSLGRVIKYSNEYQFGFGLEKFGVVKDSVF